MQKLLVWMLLSIQIMLWILGAVIQFYVLYLAYKVSFLALLLTFFTPVICQFYWIWWIWVTTGIFFSLLTIMCLVWTAALVLGCILLLAYR
jgi:hypothetical protein